MSGAALPVQAEVVTGRLSDGGRERGAPTPASLSYLDHFGFDSAPFGLTPDTGFFHAAPPHQEALNTLLYALAHNEGFIKIVGAVGTGKTILCRTLLARLPDTVQAIYLPNPALDADGILFAVADELGLGFTGDEARFRVHNAIRRKLLDLAQRDVHVVMIVDEAQAMPVESLELIRLLSNLETEQRKLLTIVLFGQPELDARLDAIPQLRTRISFHERLRALARDELADYLACRLVRAGRSAAQPALFEAAALDALHRASAGVPRIANVVSHKALMRAYGRGDRRVRRRDVVCAAADTLAARCAGHPARWRIALLLVCAVTMTVFVAAGFLPGATAWRP